MGAFIKGFCCYPEMALECIIKDTQRREFEQKVQARYESLLKKRKLDELPVLRFLTGKKPSNYLVQNYFREYLERPSFTPSQPCFFEFSRLKEVSGVWPMLQELFVRRMYYRFSISQQRPSYVPLIDVV